MHRFIATLSMHSYASNFTSPCASYASPLKKLMQCTRAEYSATNDQAARIFRPHHLPRCTMPVHDSIILSSPTAPSQKRRDTTRTFLVQYIRTLWRIIAVSRARKTAFRYVSMPWHDAILIMLISPPNLVLSVAMGIFMQESLTFAIYKVPCTRRLVQT